MEYFVGVLSAALDSLRELDLTKCFEPFAVPYTLLCVYVSSM